MRLAVVQAMLLTLWRDRAGFALTFLLPPIIYLIFAAIFSNAASGSLSIRIAVSGPVDEVTSEIRNGLSQSDLIETVITLDHRAENIARVQSGEVDAGIHIVRTDRTELPDFEILFDGTRRSAAAMAEAALAEQETKFLSEEEDEGDIPTGSDRTRSGVSPASKTAINRSSTGDPIAAYYAAGVAMLFIFLSGFQGALSVLEERDAGIIERIAAGPFGIHPLIEGKFAFLTGQGMAQIFMIFLVGALFFQVPIWLAPMTLGLSILAAALCAAGFTLAIVTLCRTKNQANALGAVITLILGALGGSMAPRFLMSEDVQVLGALTPNAWGIEAFSFSLWREMEWSSYTIHLCLLAGVGLVGLLCARAIAKYSLRQH